MAKSIKLEVGDIFRVRLLNGMYVFGHIVFFVPKRNKTKYQELNLESYLVEWYRNCMLVDIYSQISYSNVLESKDIFFKGVFFSSSDLSAMDENTITIIGNETVDVKEVEFPETIGANLEDGFFLQRGELKLRLSNVSNSLQEKLMGISNSFKDIYSVADAVLFLQNRKSEMQRSYYDGWKHTPSILKYYPDLRTKIYKLLGENPNQSYYDMALKYGFDLARWWCYKKYAILTYNDYPIFILN